MGIVLDARRAMRLLGEWREQPLIAHQYRGVMATQHALEPATPWTWLAQPANGDEVSAMLIAAVPLTVVSGDGQPFEVPAGSLYFLHPHRDIKITATGTGTAMCAWVPWHALDDIESGVSAPGEPITGSALGRGLQAFLASLLTQHSDPTVYTDYLVERLIVEMVFSVLIEAAPRSTMEGGKGSSIERARSLMLMRRAERDFGVAALARDMHMSVRQLQRLFAAEGSAPAEELRRIRVELARELMSDADYRPLGIAEIAEHAGFSDAAGLRRAFALAGLPSPRVVRKAALA